MRAKSLKPRTPAEQVVKDIRRATRKHYLAEDKIRIVLDGLRGEDSIAELCRRLGIAQNAAHLSIVDHSAQALVSGQSISNKDGDILKLIKR